VKKVPNGHPLHTHTDGLEDREWYACERPEAPHDPDFTAYWSECNACNLALTAARMNMPGESVDLRTPADPTGRQHNTLV